QHRRARKFCELTTQCREGVVTRIAESSRARTVRDYRHGGLPQRSLLSSAHFFRNRCMRFLLRGMSVLEVTMAVGVVALVAAVAVPSMDTYLNRGKAAHAIGDIGTISVQLYRWQSNTRKFPETLAEAGLSGFVDPWGNPYQYVNVATA